MAEVVSEEDDDPHLRFHFHLLLHAIINDGRPISQAEQNAPSVTIECRSSSGAPPEDNPYSSKPMSNRRSNRMRPFLPPRSERL